MKTRKEVKALDRARRRLRGKRRPKDYAGLVAVMTVIRDLANK